MANGGTAHCRPDQRSGFFLSFLDAPIRPAYKGRRAAVEPLIIGTLLDNESGLGHPRLVTLSACETGRYDTQRAPEEFVGLPATFMQLGATGVLATLWQADDLATALLMTRTE